MARGPHNSSPLRRRPLSVIARDARASAASTLPSAGAYEPIELPARIFSHLEGVQSVLEVGDNGTEHWYRADTEKLHRLEGPAVIKADGEIGWYVDGRPYHPDRPSIERPDGSREWHTSIYGLLSREDGPALEHASGGWSWWRHGALHREGGPAWSDGRGSFKWYVDGVLHRMDGPAVVSPRGDHNEWWLHGEGIHETYESNELLRQWEEAAAERAALERAAYASRTPRSKRLRA